jgi:nitrate reductase alpha subunit
MRAVRYFAKAAVRATCSTVTGGATIKAYGPDRCSGFSPIPAMSIVSHAAGNRFIQLIGGVMTSFYD